MIPCNVYPLGQVIPVFFTTYGKTNGESITASGLAVTDIEIYKGTSITQWSSDAGYALIDTDGLDIDSTTGLHAFSIDTGDNTDAGFYVAGSIYHVVVSAITVDSQTVTFIAERFRLVAAESVAGVPEVDVTHFNGSAGTFASGIPEVKVASLANNAITAASINADAITAAKIADGAIDANTFAAGAITASAIAADAIGASELAADAIAEIADAVWDEDTTGHTTAGTFGEQLKTDVDAILVDTGTTLDGKIDTIDTNVDSILADTGTDGVVVASINANAITASAIADGAIDAGAIAADAITAAKIAAGAIDADALATDAVNEIADGLLNRDMSTGTDSGSATVRTPRQALRFLRNKWAVSGGTLTVYKEDDSTSSWTGSVSTDASADPVTGNDPASS